MLARRERLMRLLKLMELGQPIAEGFGRRQYFFEACWTLVLRKVTSVSERLAHYFLAQAGFKKTEGSK
ncbi:hypothetical protein CYMTET_26207 [Cymbomonas tetramitiformis]|uniref:Uncharacterized protein n=1 Tax=Cymbomonas tetramitiformis TaxID=36881 RepID=A0AAE0FST7_9CHLO|nr:hypothetical protein CYMTET_26207 [Cymbomonas tetramitiformis]